MQCLAYSPGMDQLPLGLGGRCGRPRKQDVSLFVVNHVETPRPGHQIAVGVQKLRPPALTSTVNGVDEIERGVSAEQADVLDGFLTGHLLNIGWRNDLSKSEL